LLHDYDLGAESASHSFILVLNERGCRKFFEKNPLLFYFVTLRLEWAVRIGTAYQDGVKPPEELRGAQRLADFSCNTLSEMQDIEVDQKSKLLSAKLKIGDKRIAEMLSTGFNSTMTESSTSTLLVH